jgi:hypothetical protein
MKSVWSLYRIEQLSSLNHDFEVKLDPIRIRYPILQENQMLM